MNEKPFISVVIPLYNKQDYILRSVQSVLDQTYDRLELIVIDDGSTDNSAVRLAACQDVRLRRFFQHNAGEGAARNAGIRNATHDWVAFLDADDQWHPNFLETIVGLTQNYPETDVCATGYHIEDGQRPKDIEIFEDQPERLVTNYFSMAYQNQLPFCASSVAIRRSTLLSVGGFAIAEELGADQDLWCRLLTNSSFAFNQNPLATYHVAATGRVCVQYAPKTELPFSVRLQEAIDAGQISEDQVNDARRYVAAHLLYLAKLNIQSRDWQSAWKFISDERCKYLPMKRVIRQLQFILAQPFGASRTHQANAAE